MFKNDPFHFPPLSRAQKAKMLDHAQQVLHSQQQMLRKNGKNILHHTLQRKRRHVSMDHYPKGDRIDKVTGAQYFYHCHREDEISEEHGHFHCFLRYPQIPKYIRPTPLSDWKEYLDNPMTHLVAIGMNRYGHPIRLFTVNRWITSELWYDAQHAPKFLKRFKMSLADDPYWIVLDQWVEAMLKLFTPQIIWLHQQRDLFITQQQAQKPGENIYNDKTIEELSEIKIDLKQQVQWLIETPA
jgi:hypothetical protein